MIVSLLKTVVNTMLLAACLLTMMQVLAQDVTSSSVDSSSLRGILPTPEEGEPFLQIRAINEYSDSVLFEPMQRFYNATGYQVQVMAHMLGSDKDGKWAPLLNVLLGKLTERRLSDQNRVNIDVDYGRSQAGNTFDGKMRQEIGNEKPFEEFALKTFKETIANFQEQGLDSIKNTKAIGHIIAALGELQKGATPPLSYSVESVEEAINKGIESANDYHGNTTDAACNLCVRATLWYLASNTVLFPFHGNWIGDKEKSPTLYGRITEFDHRHANNTDFIGNANSIAATLEKAGKVPELVAISNMVGASIPDFKQLQRWANAGQLIVGVLKKDNEAGHVVMIAPGDSDLSKEGAKYDYKTIGSFETLMPKVLDCGSGNRDKELSLQWGVGINDIPSMKWYRVVGTYTQTVKPKNK